MNDEKNYEEINIEDIDIDDVEEVKNISIDDGLPIDASSERNLLEQYLEQGMTPEDAKKNVNKIHEKKTEANNRIAKAKKELDVVVEETGFGIWENKPDDKKELFKQVNKNAYWKLYEILVNYKNDFISCVRARLSNAETEYENLFFESVEKDILKYDAGKRKRFGNFFYQWFYFRCLDSLDRTHKKVEEKDDNNQIIVKKYVPLYTLLSIDKDNSEEKSAAFQIEDKKDQYENLDAKEIFIDTELQVIKLLRQLKKAQLRMSRIFFTNGVIAALEGVDPIYYTEDKHSAEIMENLDQNMVDYLMIEKIMKLYDMLNSHKKTYPTLREMINDITSNPEIIGEYKECFEAPRIKNSETGRPYGKIPGNLILAFLYYDDCRTSDNKPVMHDPGYVSKYKREYYDLISHLR